MLENDPTTFGMRALIQLILATADVFFMVNIYTVLHQIETHQRDLMTKVRFALYPWLVILPIHAAMCIWHFLLYIGAMLGEPSRLVQ